LPLVAGERVIAHVRLGPRRDRDVVDALSWCFVVFDLPHGNCCLRSILSVTLPAGVIADVVNRRAVILSAVLRQATCSALLALGAVLWATGVAHVGLDLSFPVAAVLALAVLVLGQRFSINFATEASVEAAPLDDLHDFPRRPWRPRRSDHNNDRIRNR
jgi:hypothetical protein